MVACWVDSMAFSRDASMAAHLAGRLAGYWAALRDVMSADWKAASMAVHSAAHLAVCWVALTDVMWAVLTVASTKSELKTVRKNSISPCYFPNPQLWVLVSD